MQVSVPMTSLQGTQNDWENRNGTLELIGHPQPMVTTSEVTLSNSLDCFKPCFSARSSKSPNFMKFDEKLKIMCMQRLAWY